MTTVRSCNNPPIRMTLLACVAGMAVAVLPAMAEPAAAAAPQKPISAAPGTNAFEHQTLDLGGGIDLAMVWIPAGEFIMGTTNSPSGDEKPVHRVRVARGFWIGKYEVTQAQWDRVMATNEATTQALDLPVYNISWNEAQAFASNLNALVAARWNGPAGRFRLPSEIEWEYACRAGSTSMYCSGDTEADLAKVGWYSENSGGTVHSVGTRELNAWGLCDMHGNVAEWCDNPMDPYPLGRKLSAKDEHSKDNVSRGGDYRYSNDGFYCGSAIRTRRSPGNQEETIGIRIVLVTP